MLASRQGDLLFHLTVFNAVCYAFSLNVVIGNFVHSNMPNIITAQSDYIPIRNEQIQFTSTKNSSSVLLSIIDDRDIEKVERLLANLEVYIAPGPAVRLNPIQATVIIISNDCKLNSHM